jgi:hypothetical protein
LTRGQLIIIFYLKKNIFFKKKIFFSKKKERKPWVAVATPLGPRGWPGLPQYPLGVASSTPLGTKGWLDRPHGPKRVAETTPKRPKGVATATPGFLSFFFLKKIIN